jgi:hypothetical protein
MSTVRHYQNIGAVTISASAPASSTAIPYGEFSQGQIFVPSGSSLTTLTWHVYDPQAGAWVAAYAADGTTAVTSTVAASRAVPIPASLAGASMIAAVGNAAGTVNVEVKA